MSQVENSCAATNNLCVESISLKIGPNLIYFPYPNLIPVYQSPNDYLIKLFPNSLPTKCTLTDPLESYPIDYKIVNKNVASTVINITKDYGFDVYHLEMYNDNVEFSQCILGPSFNGKFMTEIDLGNLKLISFWM